MEIIIRPDQPWFHSFSEIWKYRELLYVFVWRNLKIRYKQTVLGVGWVIFQPVITTVIFSVFFGKLAQISSETLPYPFFAYIGLMVWTSFAAALALASSSIVNMGSIIKKVYFPRILIPLSAVLTALVDLAVSIIPLIVLCIYFNLYPAPWVWPLIPIFILVWFLAASGLGMFLAALNVRYRDVGFIIPFFLQIGLFVTPVIYPLSVIFDHRKSLLILNPLSGIIENLRAAFIAGKTVDINLILIALAVSSLAFVTGVIFFRYFEKSFADVV